MITEQRIEEIVSAVAELDASADDVFATLANSRRRQVLGCLGDAPVPMALADLAQEIAVRESNGGWTDVDEDDRKAVYASLHHVHVPKLVEAGLVAYDQERRTVEATGPGDALSSEVELSPV